MAFQDLVGWLAAALVLATFSARTMVPLRALAVGSNVAFVAYAYMAGLWPVLLLHAVMLPLNAARLRQGIAGGSAEIAEVPADRAPHRHIAAANDNHREEDGEAVTALARI